MMKAVILDVDYYPVITTPSYFWLLSPPLSSLLCVFFYPPRD